MARVSINLDAAVAANTAAAGVLFGTPVTAAYVARSLVWSNEISNADLAIVANRGGNSEEYFFADGSAGQLSLTSPAAHMLVKTVSDSNQVRINSRAYTQATGDSIGLQCKPNQTVTSTGSVVGGEFSPRFNDAGGGTLICLKADPVVKDATTTRTISAVRAIEINIDLPNAGSAYTFTNDVSAIRIFPDFGAGHTFSGVRANLEIAAPNTSNFDVFMEIEAGNATWINTTASLGSQIGQILVRVGGTTRALGYYATS